MVLAGDSRPWLVLLAIAAVAVAAKALAYLLVPPQSYEFAEQIPVYTAHRMALMTHVTCSVLAMACGILQVVLLRYRMPGAMHRWTGRIYLLSVLGGGIAALPLAWMAWGGAANTAAFGLLAVLWMLSTVQAVRAIRNGDLATHRIWIARSFALTLAGITLRAEVGLLQLAGLAFDDAYRIAAWSCWVLNLLAVEWSRPSAANQRTGGGGSVFTAASAVGDSPSPPSVACAMICKRMRGSQ